MKNNLMKKNLIEALAVNYIIDGEEEIKVNEVFENEFEVYENDLLVGEYKIYDHYNKAKKDAIDYCTDMLDDGELTNDIINMAIINDMIDESYFVEAWEEIHMNIAQNEGLDYIIEEEEQEQLDNGEISEDDIRDNYFEALQNSILGGELEEYLYQFGEEETYNLIRYNNLIDIEELATYIVDTDGVGHFLATYDGEELEHNEYYAYRTN